MKDTKYLCDVQALHFVVASISVARTTAFTDTQESHFSFAVFGVEPEEFIKALEDLIRHRDDPETYRQFKEVTLNAVRAYDTIRMTRDCTTLAITRGNRTVLYCGSIDRLRGLPKVLKAGLTPS